MADGVLVLSKSGQGKSTSIRNFNPDEVMVIQCKNKRLPFPHSDWKYWDKTTKTGSIFIVNNFAEVRAVLLKMQEIGKKVVVIDDLVFLFANKVMDDINVKGFEKWTEIAIEFDQTIKTIENLKEDMRVYILTHIDTNEFGEVSMKTAGKLIENLLNPVAGFTIVLGVQKTDTGSSFITNGNAATPYKSPMGMWKDKLIPNDLKEVDDRICDFWNIENKTTTLKTTTK